MARTFPPARQKFRDPALFNRVSNGRYRDRSLFGKVYSASHFVDRVDGTKPIRDGIRRRTNLDRRRHARPFAQIATPQRTVPCNLQVSRLDRLEFFTRTRWYAPCVPRHGMDPNEQAT